MAATVLLYETDPDLYSLVNDVLTVDGHRVTWARTFEEARSVVESGEADLFLSDSGSAAVDQAMENYRTHCKPMSHKVPTLLFTVHPVTQQEAAELGCADVISKPFDIDDLLRRVQANLSQS